MRILKNITALTLVLLMAGNSIVFADGLNNQLNQETTPSSSQNLDQFIQSETNAQNMVDFKNEMMQLTASVETQNFYDAEGRLIREDIYEDGVLKQKNEYFYTASGRVFSKTETSYDPSGQVTGKIEYAYDTDGPTEGIVIFQREYGPDGKLIRQTLFSYDAEKNVLYRMVLEYQGSSRYAKKVEYFYTPEGDLTRQSEYYFDTAGLATKWVTLEFDPAGALAEKTEYIYDPAGHLVRTNYFDPSTGELQYYETYSYDASYSALIWLYRYSPQDRLLNAKQYNPDGSLLTETVYLYSAAATLEIKTYDAAGTLRVWTIYSGSSEYAQYGAPPGGSVVIEYDSNGQETKRTLYDAFGNVVPPVDAQTAQQSAAISLWFTQNQDQGTSGLIATYPDATGFIYHDGIPEEWAKIYANTQAYTYDQALAGMTLLRQGNAVAAKKIFDFYYAQWQAEQANFAGFWTVYNTQQDFQWKKYEWRKGMGENVWIALFCLQYEKAITDGAEKAKCLDLAAAIGRWVSSLPHKDGAVAMGPSNLFGSPNYGNIYSTENNLDYYALTKVLSVKAPAVLDRELFAGEFFNLENWLKTLAYDPGLGLFKTGGSVDLGSGQWVWDTTKSLDVNSWAISTIGISTLITDFGINMDTFLNNIHQTFAVQDDGSFGGDISTAKGFDFSDAVNASIIGRLGMKWIEGTNQMILNYRLLADFYKLIDPAKSLYYQNLADYFSGRNADNAIVAGSVLSYLYADRANEQIYYYTNTWRTSPGSSAPSTAWVYFALNKFNPFEI